MALWKRNLALLFLGVLFCASSYTMVIPFLPLYLQDLGVTEDTEMWSGIVFSITFLISAVMAPIWGSLSDKYGKKKMVLRAGFSLVVVYFLGGLVTDVWQLLGVRALHGLVAGFVPASIAIVATNTPEAHMGFSLGLMNTAGAAGGILGPLLGGFLSEAFGMRMSFTIASACVLGATLLVWLFVREENVGLAKQRSKVLDDCKQAWHNKPLVHALGLLLLLQIVTLIIQPLLTLHIADLQGGTEGAQAAAGFVFSVAGIAVVIASPIWGRFGQKIGYHKVLWMMLFAGGLFSIAQVFWQDLVGFTALRFLIGVALAGMYPALNAVIVERTSQEFRGRAFGLATSANMAGGMIGPLIGGLLGGWFGIIPVFLLTGVLLLAIGFNLWSASRRQPQKHQTRENPATL